MKTYQNELSICVPDSNLPASVGDPFVMRFNGRYYFYPSSSQDLLATGKGAIFAWVSEDMIHWESCGAVAQGEELMHAYAPEVFYYNGKFLMVTSPRGEGHYLLESDSPLGPFSIVRENFGLTIDGDLFADDDGQLYFTHAEFPCIHAHTFTPAGETGPAVPLEGSEMGHWTEGPMIFKRDGRYYITMTGNHLLSRGYRVNYAVSDKDPLGPYRVLRNRTLLVDTSLNHGSLGHSSTAIGPDLDSYWIFYHNYQIDEHGRHTVRRSNVDRLVFNGVRMSVAGPTFSANLAPEPASFSAWADESAERFEPWEDGVLTDTATPEQYTAEINLVPGNSAVVRFGACEVRFLDGEIAVMDADGNEAARAKLIDGFNSDALHNLRAEVRMGEVNFAIDRMCLIHGLPLLGMAGKIGARGARRISHVAFSGHVHQRSDFEYPQPVPGEFDAALFLPFEKDGCTGGNRASECGDRPEDGMRMAADDEGAWMLMMKDGERASWRVNVACAGTYRVQIFACSESGAVVEFSAGEQRLLSDIGAGAGGWVSIGNARFEAGFGTVSISVRSGDVALERILIIPAAQPERIELAGLSLCHGVRQIEGGGLLPGEGGFIDRWEGLQMDRPIQALGILGDRYHRDCELEAEVIFRGDRKEKSAGLFLRISQDSYYPDQVAVGHRGYYIGFDTERVFVGRMDFDMEELAEAPCPLEIERSYTLKARVFGDSLEVWLDGRSVLTARDARPLPFGSVGVGSFGARVTFTRAKMEAE